MQHITRVQVGQGSCNLPCSDQNIVQVWTTLQDLLRLGLPEPALLNAVLYSIGAVRFLLLFSPQMQQSPLQ